MSIIQWEFQFFAVFGNSSLAWFISRLFLRSKFWVKKASNRLFFFRWIQHVEFSSRFQERGIVLFSHSQESEFWFSHDPIYWKVVFSGEHNSKSLAAAFSKTSLYSNWKEIWFWEEWECPMCVSHTTGYDLCGNTVIIFLSNKLFLVLLFTHVLTDQFQRIHEC